jgi:hypothetical protein
MRPKRATVLLLFPALLAAIVAGPMAFAGGKATVAASFTFSPSSPVTGDLITFTSTSVASGRGNSVATFEWDLNGDGRFDDATGPVVQRSFLSSGPHIISLRVTDAHHNTSDATQAVTVTREGTTSGPQFLLSPIPVVRIAGRASGVGARLSRLSVAAPRGTTVSVHCRGRGCPLRRQTRRPSAHSRTNASGLKIVRFRRFEHRLLRRGVVVKVFVTRPGTIGKYTRFKIRRRRAPLRNDRCAVVGTTAPIDCPVS